MHYIKIYVSHGGAARKFSSDDRKYNECPSNQKKSLAITLDCKQSLHGEWWRAVFDHVTFISVRQRGQCKWPTLCCQHFEIIFLNENVTFVTVRHGGLGKWQILWGQHFEMHLVEWKFWHFVSHFLKVYLRRHNKWYVTSGSDNGLVSKRQDAIT